MFSNHLSLMLWHLLLLLSRHHSAVEDFQKISALRLTTRPAGKPLFHAHHLATYVQSPNTHSYSECRRLKTHSRTAACSTNIPSIGTTISARPR
jgi:hypothetical protein